MNEKLKKRFIALLAMLLIVLACVAQGKHQVSGTVTDDQGEPLPGASIRLKGGTSGTATNADGQFSLMVDGSKVTVVVSFIGMTAREVTLTAGKPTTIALTSEGGMLDELIVSGFQTISRERSTGSAVILNTEKLDKVQTVDLSSKLEGLSPGLMIYNNAMSIRGTSSFAVSGTPLLVIDGQPAMGIGIDDINPEIIDNVTVLKDAAATSLYGVRAANGVIVVTTKQAGKESLDVSVSANCFVEPLPSFSYQHFAPTGDIIDLERDYLLSDPTYMASPQAYFSSATNLNNARYMSAVQMLYYGLSKGDIDENQLNTQLDALRQNDYRREYRDRLQRTSLTQDYNVTLSQGSKKNKFFASGRFQHVAPHATYNRSHKFSFYLKDDIEVAPWLHLTLGTNASFDRSRQSEATGLGYTAAMPYDRLLNADGTHSYRYLYNEVLAQQVNATDGLQFMGYNAIEESELNQLTTNNTYTKYFAQAVVDITRGLQAEVKMQYEQLSIASEQYDEAQSYKMRALVNEYASAGTGGQFVYNIPLGGHLLSQNTRADYYNLRMQLNYSTVLAERHALTALVGGELRQDGRRSSTSERYGYDDQKLTYGQVDWLTLSRTGVVGQLYAAPRRLSEQLAVSEVLHRYVSAYMNGGYTFDGRYALNASVRVDQADLFGTDPKYRYRPLWSVGASWNATNEHFLNSVGWLDMLKLRATYGVTGNVDQSSSPYLLAGFATSLYTNGPITMLLSPPNSSLRWEQTRTLNAGADFRLVHRLSGTFDIYHRRSSDLLVNKSIDPSLGFSGTARANNGVMENWGVELSATYDWLPRSSAHQLSTQLTAAYNRNTIKRIDYEPTDAIDMITAPRSNYRVGDAFNTLYAYRYAGLTATGDPSIYNERNEVVSIERVRNVGAVQAAGVLTPKWNGALTVDYRWRGLSAFVRLVGYAGHSLRADAVTLYDAYNPINSGAISEDIARRWTPDNTDTDIPAMALHTDVGERNYHWRYADCQVVSAAFIKLRNVGVAWQLPSSWLQPLGVKGVTLKAQVDNLMRWTRNDRDIDPEAFTANSGTRTQAMPPTYVFGVNVKL